MKCIWDTISFPMADNRTLSLELCNTIPKLANPELLLKVASVFNLYDTFWWGCQTWRFCLSRWMTMGSLWQQKLSCSSIALSVIWSGRLQKWLWKALFRFCYINHKAQQKLSTTFICLARTKVSPKCPFHVTKPPSPPTPKGMQHLRQIYKRCTKNTWAIDFKLNSNRTLVVQWYTPER